MYYAEVGGTNVPARNSIATQRLVPRQRAGRLRAARGSARATARRSRRPRTCRTPRPRVNDGWQRGDHRPERRPGGARRGQRDAASRSCSSTVATASGTPDRVGTQPPRLPIRAPASAAGLERLRSSSRPAVLLFLVFVVGPFLFAILLSFYSWDLLTPREFVGLENFRDDARRPAAAQGAARTRSCSRSPRWSPTSSAGCCSRSASTGSRTGRCRTSSARRCSSRS